MFLDGETIGDGSSEPSTAMCQKEDPLRKCLSTGECRSCKFVEARSDGMMVNRYEGCDIKTGAPICDADKSSDSIQFAKADYDLDNTQPTLLPACAACKKMGR